MKIKSPSWYHLGQILVLVGLTSSVDFFAFGAIIITCLAGLLEGFKYISAGLLLLAHKASGKVGYEDKQTLISIFDGSISYWVSSALSIVLCFVAAYNQWVFTSFVWGIIAITDELYRRWVFYSVPTGEGKGHPHGVESPR